jgi:hypothetical protein
VDSLVNWKEEEKFSRPARRSPDEGGAEEKRLQHLAQPLHPHQRR